MKTIRLHDKTFQARHTATGVSGRMRSAGVADRINKDYARTRDAACFVGVLNGSFMFMAELMQRITLDLRSVFRQNRLVQRHRFDREST